MTCLSIADKIITVIYKLVKENSYGYFKACGGKFAKIKMIYHEDTQALHIGTLDKHCYFVPFAKGQDPLRTVKILSEWSF